MARHILGIDVGFEQDPSALALVRVIIPRTAVDPEDGTVLDADTMRPPELPEGVTLGQYLMPQYQVIDLQRRQRNLTFAAMGAEAEKVVDHLAGRGGVRVLVDCTGVGRGAVEAIRSRGTRACAVWIGSGTRVTGDGVRKMTVPHAVLYETLYAVMAQGRLAVADGLDGADKLREELLAAEMVRTDTGKAHYEVNLHDSHGDLTVALALAVVDGERRVKVRGGDGQLLSRNLAPDNQPRARPSSGRTRRGGNTARRVLDQRLEEANARARREMAGNGPWGMAWDELADADD